MIGKFCLILLALFLVYDYETGAFTFGDSAERCEIAEGLYYNQENEFINKLVEHWPLSQRTYSKEYGASPWIPTGDGRTGLPFLLNLVRDFSYTRVWLPLDDGEVTALDIGFPEAGHDVTKPLYLILHGLNGGSQEGYVQDFTWRRTGEGSTVVVMIARGLGDLPIRGWDVFHGARISDAHTAALRLRQTLVGDQYIPWVPLS
jgi:predicted alpha/beta-fold hydrolase